MPGATCRPRGLCAWSVNYFFFLLKTVLLRDVFMKYKCETCFKRAERGDERRVCAGGSTQLSISQLQLIIYGFHNTSCDLGAQDALGAGRPPP